MPKPKIAAVAEAVPVERKKDEPAKAKPTARQLAEEDRIEIVVDSGGVQGNGAAAPIVERANLKYEEGMRFYRGYTQGPGGNNAANNRALQSAEACLEAAVALYDEALKKDPGNKAILDRQTQANMTVYACKKYRTLH